MFPVQPWRHAGLHFPEETQMLRACIRHHRAMRGDQRWVPWPNCNVTFSFGANKRPLPIGALFTLWESGPPFVSTCLECGGGVLATSFGGLCNVGTIGGMCLDCALGQSRRICGIPEAIAFAVPALANTEFRIAESVLGDAVTAPRLPIWEALTALGEQDLPSREWAMEKLEHGLRWMGPAIRTMIAYPSDQRTVSSKRRPPKLRGITN